MQNDISSLFTQVYAIVLPSRKEYIKNTFRKMGITYTEFNCVLGSTLDKTKLINDGVLDPNSKISINETACVLSHIGVIKKFYETSRNSNDTCIIFEDDVSYEDDHYSKLKKCMDDMPKDWEFINFGRCWDFCFSQKKINEYIVVSESSQCAHSYAITRTCAKKILDSCFPILEQIDQFYVHNCKNLFTIYSSSPRIYNQLRMTETKNTFKTSLVTDDSDSGPECSIGMTDQLYKNKNKKLILFFLLIMACVFIFKSKKFWKT